MTGPRAGPIPGSIALIQCTGGRSWIESGRWDDAEARSRPADFQSERNLGGKAFVGKLDAPEIAGGVEDFDAQFKAAVELARADTDHAEFLGLL